MTGLQCSKVIIPLLPFPVAWWLILSGFQRVDQYTAETHSGHRLNSQQYHAVATSISCAPTEGATTALLQQNRFGPSVKGEM